MHQPNYMNYGKFVGTLAEAEKAEFMLFIAKWERVTGFNRYQALCCKQGAEIRVQLDKFGNVSPRDILVERSAQDALKFVTEHPDQLGRPFRHECLICNGEGLAQISKDHFQFAFSCCCGYNHMSKRRHD